MIEVGCIIKQYKVSFIDQQHSVLINLTCECNLRIVDYEIDIDAEYILDMLIDFLINTFQQFRTEHYGELFAEFKLAFVGNDTCNYSRLTLTWWDGKKNSPLTLAFNSSDHTSHLIIVEVVIDGVEL